MTARTARDVILRILIASKSRGLVARSSALIPLHCPQSLARLRRCFGECRAGTHSVTLRATRAVATGHSDVHECLAAT
jgi:hypothetical protein